MSDRSATKRQRASLCQMAVCLIGIGYLTALVACSNSSNSSSNAGPPSQIGGTSGSGQQTSVGTAFPNPLTATVEDSANNPVSGASVTFTAPGTGASGTFANGKITETDTTNSSGVATSSTFTANSIVSVTSRYNVTASVSGVSSTVSYSLQNLPPATVTATQGNAQGTLINTSFAQTLQVTIILQNQPQSGVSVTFKAPSSGASGTFATSPPSTSATATTDSNGVATAPAFTANGTTGVYQATATASDSPTPATFDLINASSTSSPFAAGNYVFSLSGTDANDSFYSVAGVFAVDANGLISTGYQTFSDVTYTAPYEPIAGGGALVSTSDGNVRIILNTENTHIGVGGSGEEIFDAAVISGSKAFLTEFDDWATASGELDAQTLPTTNSSPCPTMPCSYAFVSSGEGPGMPFAMGGIFTIASANSISSGIFDANNNSTGTQFQGQAISSSSFTNINTFGVLQFTLNLNALAPDVVFDGYIVDSNHIRLVESGGRLNVVAGGVALGQTGTNLGSVCTSGTSYVIGLSGNDHSGADNNGRLQVAGLFTMPTSSSTLGGALNHNDLSGTGTQQPTTITGGNCTPDTTYLGRVSINGITTTGPTGLNLQLYVTGDSDGDVLAITLDSTDTEAGHGFQQTGGASFAASSFAGTYALDATGVNAITSTLTSENEFDAVGTVAANGSGGISASGTLDLNWIFNTGPSTGLSISSGSYTANSDGVFTGTLTGLDVASASTADAFSFYLVDNAGANGSSSRVIAIETDTNQLSLDFFEQQ